MSEFPVSDKKAEEKPKKKSKPPPQTDYSKTAWGIFVGPLVGLLSAALAAWITGYFNAPKVKDADTHGSITNNIVNNIRIGTYVGAKAVLELAATPAIANSPLGDRFGSVAQHLSFMEGSEWSAGAASSNRVIQFSLVLRASAASQATNGTVTFVLKRGQKTVCTATINTQTANKDNLSAWQRTTCEDEIPAGLDASYVAEIKSSNVSLAEVYAENVVANKL